MASRPRSGEVHKGIGVSIHWERPWPGGLDAKGTLSAAAPLDDFISWYLIATLSSVI